MQRNRSGGNNLPFQTLTHKITWPIKPAISLGALGILGTIGTIIFVLGSDLLKQPPKAGEEIGSMVYAQWFCVSGFALGMLIFLFFRAKYKRLEYEQKLKEGSEGEVEMNELPKN
jgi:membrane-bound ClpP family serine protease